MHRIEHYSLRGTYNMINLKPCWTIGIRSKRLNAVWVHLYEILEYVKQLNNDRKRSVGAGQGREG